MVSVPAVYATTVQHVRRSPFRHAFRYRSRWWLVDLDDLPVRRLLRFEARDHVGDPRLTLRANVDALLAREGLACSRVLMLTSPRALGHVFNPLSVFWCLDDSGAVVATVAEVHNTYGGRYAYVLEAGASTVGKGFYVSPFHEVAGHYDLRLPLPGDDLALSVTYRRPGAEPFVASVRGTRVAASAADLLVTRLVAARIRFQGVRLWLRRLPVVPRPASVPDLDRLEHV